MIFVIPIVWALTMLAARFVSPLAVILIASVTLATVVAVRNRQLLRALTRTTPRIAIGAVLAAVVMVAATYLLFPVIVRFIPVVRTEASAIYARFLSSESTSLLIAAVVPVIVAEEVLWRGKFQDAAGKWSVIITPVVYAIAHAPLGSALLVAVAFVCGLYWSALRAISGSIIPPLCAHLAWDIALIVVPLIR